MKVTPSRFAYWIAHRFSSKTLDSSLRMPSSEFRFYRYADIYEWDTDKVQEYFVFSSAEFQERFAQDPLRHFHMLGIFNRAHMMKPLEDVVPHERWLPTQEMVVRSARLYQIGPITLPGTREIFSFSEMKGLLKAIMACQGVMRVALGGSWLEGNTSACLAVAVVTDGTISAAPGKLRRLIVELQWQLEYYLGVKHVMPIRVIAANDAFPKMFRNSVTIAPIANWNVGSEATSESADRQWADELYQEWAGLPQPENEKRDHRLIVQAFALRHF